MADIPVTLMSLPVSISTIQPVDAITNDLAESVLPIGLPVATVVRNRDETKTILLAGIFEPKITYASTDGIVSSGGSGNNSSGSNTYWITG